MDFFKKITLKNIANSSIMYFVYGLFPLIALLMFYDPIVSVLGLLFSYVSIIAILFVMNVLVFVKDKAFIVADIVSTKLKEISDPKVSTYAKNGVKILGVIISIGIVYFTLSVASGFLNFLSIVSVLNPLMILALNIYYVIMAMVFTGYNE